MKIKIGDIVKIIAGKDKGKSGKVIQTLRKDEKIVVEGINVAKKHQKPNNNNEKGGIIDISLPIHVSNVKKDKVEKTTTKTETKAKTTVKKETTAKATTKKTTKKVEKKDK